MLNLKLAARLQLMTIQDTPDGVCAVCVCMCVHVCAVCMCVHVCVCVLKISPHNHLSLTVNKFILRRVNMYLPKDKVRNVRRAGIDNPQSDS